MIDFEEAKMALVFGDRIMWSNIDMEESKILELSRIVDEVGTTLSGNFYGIDYTISKIETVIGECVVLIPSNERENPAYLKAYIDHVLWCHREYPDIIKNLEKESPEWKAKRRIALVKTENMGERFKLRKELSKVADWIYNLGSMDLYVILDFPDVSFEGSVYISSKEKSFSEALRKALLLERYSRESGKFLYEEIPNIVFKGGISFDHEVPEDISIFLKTGDIEEAANMIGKKAHDIFLSILNFEKEYLISPRLYMESLILLLSERMGW